MPETKKGTNPRYVAYARAHGRAPEGMLEHDREAWPGGCMCGFVLWIQERWAEWNTANGYPPHEGHGPIEQALFDRMLDERFPLT